MSQLPPAAGVYRTLQIVFPLSLILPTFKYPRTSFAENISVPYRTAFPSALPLVGGIHLILAAHRPSSVTPQPISPFSAQPENCIPLATVIGSGMEASGRQVNQSLYQRSNKDEEGYIPDDFKVLPGFHSPYHD